MIAFHRIVMVSVLLSVVGCVGYSWHSGIPTDKRTIAVPILRNESEVHELGAVTARQILREFQREGTFQIRARDEAALEIQGVVNSAQSTSTAYDRAGGLRISGYDFTMTATISLIDRQKKAILIDNRKYTATTTFAASQDLMTARRDASGRLADDLARQIVDDVLMLKFEETKKESEK